MHIFGRGLYPERIKTHILIIRKQTIQLKLAKDLNKQVSEYTNGHQAHRMLNRSRHRKMQRCKLKLQRDTNADPLEWLQLNKPTNLAILHADEDVRHQSFHSWQVGM